MKNALWKDTKSDNPNDDIFYSYKTTLFCFQVLPKIQLILAGLHGLHGGEEYAALSISIQELDKS